MNAALLWVTWLGFVGYALIVAPPDQPETWDLIQRLIRFQVAGINPLIVALFNLMGVWPGIYAAVLLTDGRGQKIPAWPFVAGSFALGAFALLPYLALRRPFPQWSGSVPWVLRLWNSRVLGAVWLTLSVGFVGYGLSQGSWGDWWQAFQTSRFIHVMSLDFVLLSVLFPLVLGDDLTRRRVVRAPWFALVSALPLVGPALYLTLRPPLPD
ncbi:hypothetical protein GlitD10_0234 [Gloeomargarita lithophora Alchichica-D10]|uniref:DUF2834 domain-containing protein n=1 Tax=Gloeomargarita lithophora Alchichica-D10 TaxID=1188229 RepID=A0A1J0A9E2_9CYAN|nr:DUF2834 domain-containing protein [Gloeomargarita lithophora]APB32535.1 hypothetical protein GlitD10_0234 [Gloeomargarita lithophora Alchichica-D10]